MLRNAKQTHRNHDIVPSILFMHRIILMKQDKKKSNNHHHINNKKQKQRKIEEKRQKRATTSNKCSMNSSLVCTIEGDGASTYLLRLFGATVHTFWELYLLLLLLLLLLLVPLLLWLKLSLPIVCRLYEFLCSIYHILRIQFSYMANIIWLRLFSLACSFVDSFVPFIRLEASSFRKSNIA